MLYQGLEGVLRDPGFSRNRVRDSGIQNKSSRDLEYYIGCNAEFALSVVRDQLLTGLKFARVTTAAMPNGADLVVSTLPFPLGNFFFSFFAC